MSDTDRALFKKGYPGFKGAWHDWFDVPLPAPAEYAIVRYSDEEGLVVDVFKRSWYRDTVDRRFTGTLAYVFDRTEPFYRDLGPALRVASAP